MSPSQIFQIGNLFVLPGWLLLVFLPGWRWTARVVGVIVPGILGLTYLYLAWRYFGETGGGFGSIEGVRQMFESDGALTAGWLHYLAFDLLVGAWETRDARRRRVHHLLVVPCLALTFMLGPVGLVCYLLVRLVVRRTLFGDAEASA